MVEHHDRFVDPTHSCQPGGQAAECGGIGAVSVEDAPIHREFVAVVPTSPLPPAAHPGTRLLDEPRWWHRSPVTQSLSLSQSPSHAAHLDELLQPLMAEEEHIRYFVNGQYAGRKEKATKIGAPAGRERRSRGPSRYLMTRTAQFAKSDKKAQLC